MAATKQLFGPFKESDEIKTAADNRAGGVERVGSRGEGTKKWKVVGMELGLRRPARRPRMVSMVRAGLDWEDGAMRANDPAARGSGIFTRQRVLRGIAWPGPPSSPLNE